MSSKPNQAWNGHKYFFLVDFTFTFHAGTWYFSATSRESLMQKPVTYTVALFPCSKMQTVFSVQRHKKAKTLSPVFCLTEPFSLPVTPNPHPSSSYSLLLPSTNPPLCMRKYTRSEKRLCLTCFGNFRFSEWDSLMTSQIPISSKMLLKIRRRWQGTSFSPFEYNFATSFTVFS